MDGRILSNSSLSPDLPIAKKNNVGRWMDAHVAVNAFDGMKKNGRRCPSTKEWKPFLGNKPDLPMPVTMTFPVQPLSKFTAFTKGWANEFLGFQQTLPLNFSGRRRWFVFIFMVF